MLDLSLTFNFEITNWNCYNLTKYVRTLNQNGKSGVIADLDTWLVESGHLYLIYA